MNGDRRRFLQGAAAALGAATVGGAARAESAVNDAITAPFEGAHQAGIVTPAGKASAFVSFDLVTTSRDEFADLLKTVTARARALTDGGAPRQLGISAPPADSGVLGPVVPTDGLSITVGLGASAFDDRFGLAASKPERLKAMDVFPNDDLDPSRTGGDLLVQLVASHADTVIHALRDITRNTRGGMQIRWRINGFQPPPRPSGAPRNLLGFHDGIANPDVSDADEMDRLVWVTPTSREPAWAVGGTYHVVRVIRMFTEFWDRVTISEQERMIGRRRDSGAPLSGSRQSDPPDFHDDPQGQAIPLDAHIRMANPRTTATDNSRILRRSYNYDGGVDSNGNLEQGLVFTCFQQDLERQFVATQKRLIDEPLVDYISPVGGGYFFDVPGVRDERDWYGSTLLG